MKTITLVVLSVVLVSCGNKAPNNGSNNESHQEGQTAENYHSRPLDITQTEDLNIVRKNQMTSRYDCTGKLVSRKIETTNSLGKKMLIDYKNRKNAWGYYVYNRRTKKSGGLTFMRAGYFVVDYSPTAFNMQVKPGVNLIEYEFYKCPNIIIDNGTYKCGAKTVVEKEGLFQINVSYSAITLPGERQIRPSEESCKPRP